MGSHPAAADLGRLFPVKSVCLAIPPLDDNYPWRAVREGLTRLGFEVRLGVHVGADALVTWSPWHGSQRQALQGRYTAEGKPIIIMENGWLSPVSRVPFWQVARDGWNGTGTFRADGPARWRSWGLAEMPWTHRGGYALVCGQRGHPSDPRTSLPGWHERLQAGQLPVVRRARDATRPLLADMKGAAEVHVWTSNAASVAVMLGIPVVQHGPNLMVSAMASRPGEPLYRGDRGLELERLAWAQWDSLEIAAGEPFARLFAA
jgi:hypothetical protein